MPVCLQPRILRPLVASLLAALTIGCASTQEPPDRVDISDEVVADVRVLAVDKPTRGITLERANGSPVVVTAGPEVRNFDQIRAGDTLSVRYVVGISARRLDPGEPDTPASIGSVAGRAAQGRKPGAVIGSESVMTVVIRTVDQVSNVVTFVTPSGALEAVEAERDEGRRFIAGLQPGDRVELVFGEVLALAVQ